MREALDRALNKERPPRGIAVRLDGDRLAAVGLGRLHAWRKSDDELHVQTLRFSDVIDPLWRRPVPRVLPAKVIQLDARTGEIGCRAEVSGRGHAAVLDFIPVDGRSHPACSGL